MIRELERSPILFFLPFLVCFRMEGNAYLQWSLRMDTARYQQDNEQARRAGAFVAEMLEDKIRRDKTKRCGENTGLRTDNEQKAKGENGHERTEYGESENTG